jgi:hypothetical protein
MTSSVEIKVRVGDGESPYRKIAVDVGRLVWSNHPLHTDDHIVLQMFGRDTILRFDNGRKGRPKKVEFEVQTASNIGDNGAGVRSVHEPSHPHLNCSWVGSDRNQLF